MTIRGRKYGSVYHISLLLLLISPFYSLCTKSQSDSSVSSSTSTSTALFLLPSSPPRNSSRSCLQPDEWWIDTVTFQYKVHASPSSADSASIDNRIGIELERAHTIYYPLCGLGEAGEHYDAGAGPDADHNTPGSHGAKHGSYEVRVSYLGTLPLQFSIDIINLPVALNLPEEGANSVQPTHNRRLLDIEKAIFSTPLPRSHAPQRESPTLTPPLSSPSSLYCPYARVVVSLEELSTSVLSGVSARALHPTQNQGVSFSFNIGNRSCTH